MRGMSIRPAMSTTTTTPIMRMGSRQPFIQWVLIRLWFDRQYFKGQRLSLELFLNGFYRWIISKGIPRTIDNYIKVLVEAFIENIFKTFELFSCAC